MAQTRHTFREVYEGGFIAVVQFGRGPDEVGLVMWDRGQRFTFWITFDGYAWERVRVETYDPEGSWEQAQHWAAHRLAELLLSDELS